MGIGVESCWVVTDGRAGMLNPALGLAEAMGLEPVVKTIKPTGWWTFLPPDLWPMPLHTLDPSGDRLLPPWPDLVISCGRRSVAAAMGIKAASGGATKCVHITHPRAPLRRFDVVVLPEHDGVDGDNAVLVTGSIGRVTPERLAAAAAAAEPRLTELPHPRVAVLIGGSNRRFVLDTEVATELGAKLAAFAGREQATLMVTGSRRTGEANMAIIRQALREVPGEVWDGSGDNPYLAYLGLADAVIVTCDSVNMISEACVTGKPVLIAPLGGRGSAKFDRFFRALEAGGHARAFQGALEYWGVVPLDETRRAAAAVQRRLGLPNAPPQRAA